MNDKLQNQIVELDKKMERLYRIVEHIGGQVSAVISENNQDRQSERPKFASLSPVKGYSYSHHTSNFRSSMEHKDVLVDSNDWETNLDSQVDNNLAPELQIRRLTAQLTAAYNRIATLEEQLLACRIHS